MKFVKGQKVIRIESDYGSVKRGCIYKVDEVRGRTGWDLKLKKISGKYSSECFETIIQSIDDVVPEMTLTTKSGEAVTVFHAYEKTSKVSTKEFPGSFSLSDFKEYKPKSFIDSISTETAYARERIIEFLTKPYFEKEKPMTADDYEVVKPFSILDIYRARPDHCTKGMYKFGEEFEELMAELDDRQVDKKWVRIENYVLSKPKNLKWLAEKGFIREKVKDVVLEPGLYLIENNFIYCIIQVGEYLKVLNIKTNVIIYSNIILVPGTSLRELNNLTSNKFKPV